MKERVSSEKECDVDKELLDELACIIDQKYISIHIRISTSIHI